MGTYQTLLGLARKQRALGKPNDQAMAQARRDFALTGLVIVRDENKKAIAPVENPTGAQMQQALNEYMPSLKGFAPDYVSPNFTPEQMEQRYAYSQQCMAVMEKLVAEHIQRDKIFEDTAQRLFGKDFGDQIKQKVDPRRWLEQLMRLDDTPEAQQHNERVVSLVMLGEAHARNEDATGKEIFRRVRTAALTKAHPEMSEEDVKRSVEDELVDPMGDLLNLTEAAMQNGPSRQEADAARDAILSGTAERDYPGGLEGAYRKLINPGSHISWNIANACDDVRSFGGTLTKEEQRRRFYPYEMNCSSTHGGVVELTANPFYAVLDPAGLVNSGCAGLPGRDDEDYATNAAPAFGADIANGLLASCNEIMWPELPRFALTSSDKGGIRNQPNNIGIYTNKRGRTVIIVSDPVSLDNGLRAAPHTDRPGHLVNMTGYSRKITDLLQESTRNDRFMHSSGKYRDLKRALNAMPREFPDNPTVEQARELERRLSDLKKAAEAYKKRKDDQFEERGTREGKDPYERARYAFGKSVLDYIEEIERSVKFVREHTETMAAVLAAEQEDVQHPIPGDVGLTPFQRKVKPEDDQLAEEQRREQEAREAQQRKEKEERDRARQKEKQEQLNAGEAIEDAMKDAKPENIGINNDAMNESSEELIGGHAITEAEEPLKKAADKGQPEKGELLELYILEAQQAYADALMDGDTLKIRSCAADLLAANAAKEFIRYGETVNPELARRFQAAADSGSVENLDVKDKDVVVVDGKVRDLVDGIKMTPKFVDLLDRANPIDPDKFGKALETTAKAVGKNAVLSVQAAVRRREEELKALAEKLENAPLQRQNSIGSAANAASAVAGAEKVERAGSSSPKKQSENQSKTRNQGKGGPIA